jgi:hypothetical protein
MSFFRFAILALGCCAAAAQAQDARALQVLKRAQRSAGGVEALAAVKDMIVIRDVQAVGGGMSGRQTVKFLLPGAMRQESSLPFGLVAVSLVDGAGSIDSPQGKSALVGPQLTQAQGELFRLRERLLRADAEPGWTVSLVESAADAGRKADILEIADPQASQRTRLWIDQSTGEFFRASFDAVALVGAQRLDEYYSDFRTVNGVQTPFRIDVFAGGRRLTEIRIEKVLHNTGLTKSELR